MICIYIFPLGLFKARSNIHLHLIAIAACLWCQDKPKGAEQKVLRIFPNGSNHATPFQQTSFTFIRQWSPSAAFIIQCHRKDRKVPIKQS